MPPSSRTALFFNGFKTPWSSIGYILRRPKIAGLLFMPVVCNTLLTIALAVFGWYVGLAPMMDRLRQGTETWWDVLVNVVISAAAIALFAFALLGLFIVLAGILGAPFHDQASEQIEREEFATHPALCATALPFLEGVIHSLREAGLRWGIFMPLLIVGMLIKLIPLIGIPLGFAISISLGGTFLVLDALSYPLDRRKFTLRGKLAWMRSHRAECVGLAAGLAMFYVIPFGWIVGPAVGAVAGTRLLARRLVLETETHLAPHPCPPVPEERA